MKRGSEHALTRGRGAIDTLVQRAMTPVFFGARKKVEQYTDGTEYDIIFNQERVGQNGAKFIIHKFSTLDNQGDPLSERAEAFRRKGIDELAQLINMHRGNVAVIGWRPEIPKEYEEYLSHLSKAQLVVHERMVLPTLPGLVSSYGAAFKQGLPEGTDHFQARFDGNERDVVNASPLYDLNLLAQAGYGVVSGRFVNANLPS